MERNYDNWATEHTYVFVLMSDGAETVASAATANRMLRHYSNFVQGSRLQCAFNVIGIGRESDTAFAMRCKDSFEVMWSAWRRRGI